MQAVEVLGNETRQVAEDKHEDDKDAGDLDVHPAFLVVLPDGEESDWWKHDGKARGDGLVLAELAEVNEAGDKDNAAAYSEESGGKSGAGADKDYDKPVGCHVIACRPTL